MVPLSTALSTEVVLVSSVTAIALVSAAFGVWFATGPRAGRALVPFGAGLLMGMAAFGVAPELAEGLGWPRGLALLLLGFALLWVFDRYVHPVCPSCSPTHDHGACSVALHGFALPLVAAAVLHSFMDGLAVGASRREGPDGLLLGMFLAVALHKIPEGLAYGAILRAALPSRLSAFAWCAVAQAPTIVGGLLESAMISRFGAHWMAYPLALVGGSFLYLGFHAVHNEFRRRGMLPSFGPALTGAAGAAAVLQGLHFLFPR
jgi:zinc transporter ZupT